MSAKALATGIGGTPAGKIFEGDRRFDVVIRLDEDARNDPAQLAALPVVSPTGIVVPLSSVARIDVSEAPTRSAAATAAAASWCRPTCVDAISAVSSRSPSHCSKHRLAQRRLQLGGSSRTCSEPRRGWRW
ncbi:MAG: efflux RND transporter permease subunit [Lysobacteraceae bacterium]